MARPKIIVLMHYMELGGAEMALLGLLHALDPERVDVDLFIYSHQGPLMEHIPSWINLLPELKKYSLIEKPLLTVLKKGHIDVVFGRLIAKLSHRIYRLKSPFNGDDLSELQFISDFTTPLLPPIQTEIEYDLCISFLTPHTIGRDKVNAKKKLAWIHTDYSTLGVNPAREFPVWKAYDYIVAISTDVRKAFVNLYPSLSSKIIEIENILPKQYIINQAEQGLSPTVR